MVADHGQMCCRAQILHLNQQIVRGEERQAQLLDSGLEYQRQKEEIKKDLQAEQEKSRILQTELDAKSREIHAQTDSNLEDQRQKEKFKQELQSEQEK